MKKVTIPLKEDDNLVLSALASLRNSLKNLNLEKNDEVQYAIFDLSGLMGIFSGEFKVTVEIEQEDIDTFVSKFGVDFPEFTEGEIVDVEPKFMHLAYIEDGELTFAIRSNKNFPGADDEGADSEDENATRFYLYKRAKVGEAVFFEGTTFVAVPTKSGWAIIENGEVIEEIKF